MRIRNSFGPPDFGFSSHRCAVLVVILSVVPLLIPFCTRAQETAMFNKIVELTERYPQAKVVGHRDFPGVNKACPSFDVKTWLANYTPDIDMAA